jgi:hypothetical protein
MNTEAALFCPRENPHEDYLAECFETQAMYIPRVYAEALAQGLVAQTWHKIKEPTWRYTGLLNEDLTPKPAYNAYKAMTSILTNTNYIGPIMGYPEGVEGYSFSKRDGSWTVDVIWSSDGISYTVTLPNGASAFDRYGEVITPQNGTITVRYSPVYIKRP